MYVGRGEYEEKRDREGGGRGLGPKVLSSRRVLCNFLTWQSQIHSQCRPQYQSTKSSCPSKSCRFKWTWRWRGAGREERQQSQAGRGTSSNARAHACWSSAFRAAILQRLQFPVRSCRCPSPTPLTNFIMIEMMKISGKRFRLQMHPRVGIFYCIVFCFCFFFLILFLFFSSSAACFALNKFSLPRCSSSCCCCCCCYYILLLLLQVQCTGNI